MPARRYVQTSVLDWLELRTPTRTEHATIESRNLFGQYNIYQNGDGTFSCTCPSFLQRRDLVNGTCKHIRNAGLSQPAGTTPPEAADRIDLIRLGITNFEDLSRDQAYFLVRDNQVFQGIQDLDRIPESLLPIIAFGVEFEGLVTRSRGIIGISQACLQHGEPCYEEGYNHVTRGHWKIVSDASVHPSSQQSAEWAPLEIVSPKLLGATGFQRMKTVLESWAEVGAKVNKSCGFHVHLDAYSWRSDSIIRLMKVWAKIEQPILYALVPVSRRNQNFCRQITPDWILNCANMFRRTARPSIGSRYYSLNLAALARHGTIEVRLHGGTSEFMKAASWVLMNQKLFEAVLNGMEHGDLQEPTLEHLLNAIKMDSHPFLRKARAYLLERNYHFKEENEAAGNPFQFEQWPSWVTSLDNIGNPTTQHHVGTSQVSTEPIPTAADESLPHNHIRNLAPRRPNERLPHGAIREATRDDGTWVFTSTTSDATHTVTKQEDDTLICTCQGFRRYRHCKHTIAVARVLINQIRRGA